MKTAVVGVGVVLGVVLGLVLPAKGQAGPPRDEDGLDNITKGIDLGGRCCGSGPQNPGGPIAVGGGEQPGQGGPRGGGGQKNPSAPMVIGGGGQAGQPGQGSPVGGQHKPGGQHGQPANNGPGAGQGQAGTEHGHGQGNVMILRGKGGAAAAPNDGPGHKSKGQHGAAQIGAHGAQSRDHHDAGGRIDARDSRGAKERKIHADGHGAAGVGARGGKKR